MTPQRFGMSERQYAAHAGISSGAVQKARTWGRLVLHADGSIDAAARSSLYLMKGIRARTTASSGREE